MKKILTTLWDQAKYAAGYEKVAEGSRVPYWLIVLEVFFQDLFCEIKHQWEMK